METTTVEKYLPLGSIVVVKGNLKKLMIIARGVMAGSGENGRLLDYGAVMYPEGLVDENMLFFNHKDIYKVVFEGYSDPDDEMMNDNIKKWVEDKRAAMKNQEN